MKSVTLPQIIEITGRTHGNGETLPVELERIAIENEPAAIRLKIGETVVQVPAADLMKAVAALHAETLAPIKPLDWNLRDQKMPPDYMIAAIQSAQSVPDAWKNALVASVNAMTPRPAFLRLDAHCHFSGKLLMLTASIAPI